MTVNLSRIVDVQKITVNLSNVMGADGSTLSSAAVSMNVLAGDVDADKSVLTHDLSTVRNQVGHTLTSANFRDDVKGDGTIDNGDVRTVRQDLGHSLP
jgi:hypothetical protein